LERTTKPAFRAPGDEFERLVRRKRFADAIAQLAEIGGGEAAHGPPIGSKPRQIREWQSAAMDMKATELGAAMQLGKHLARI